MDTNLCGRVPALGRKRQFADHGTGHWPGVELPRETLTRRAVLERPVSATAASRGAYY